MIVPIFPYDCPAITLTTTVWIGVLVVALFNLRLGWPLSGLVIPGFLTPLLISKPIAFYLILFEAIVTFWIVAAMSEILRNRRSWSSLFGRDRFFGIILVSILVRSLAEGVLLPKIGPLLNEWLGLSIDYRNDLHSFGLIVVALLANYFWKPGLIRGLGCFATCVGLTYAIVQVVLVRMTNFNMGALNYIYDDVSTSLLSSPKSYIILVTTAYLASRFNLRYAWDFNGILIPALLALRWHEPIKVASSFAEAGLIFLVARLILKLPIWRRVTMEGGRRLVLFFTVCFLYRLMLSHFLRAFFPGTTLTDAYGLGYLLTTLMAIKAHQKNIPYSVAKATFQVSMLGAVVGNLIGFGLCRLANPTLPALETDPIQSIVAASNDADAIADLVQSERIRLRRQRLKHSYVAPTPTQIALLESGFRSVSSYLDTGNATGLELARRRLDQAGMQIFWVGTRYLLIREQEPCRGWGFAAFDTEHPNGLAIQVPAPLEEHHSTNAALHLMKRLKGSSLVVSGTTRTNCEDGQSDPLYYRQTMLGIAHRALHRDNTIMVRTAPQADEPISLWVKRSLPSALRLAAFGDLPLEIHWSAHPTRNVIRQSAKSGFAEIFFNRSLALDFCESVQCNPDSDRRLRRESGPILSKIVESKASMAPPESELYIPPRMEELIFFDEAVITPLVPLLQSGKHLSEFSPGDLQQLNIISAAARSCGYELVGLEDPASSQSFLFLREFGKQKNYRGFFAFRLGKPAMHVVEVLRPLLERQSIEFGASLFDRQNGFALLIPTAHPNANRTGESDLARLSNRANLFNLVQHVLLRESRNSELLIVQARSIRAPVDADLVVASDRGHRNMTDLPKIQQEFIETLHRDGLTTTFVNGQPQTAGYELGILLQASSLNHTLNKHLISLWVSPSLRSKYRFGSEDTGSLSQMLALDIPSTQAPLSDYLRCQSHRAVATPVPEEVRSLISNYLETQNIIALKSLMAGWPDYQLHHIQDASSGQSFLAIFPSEDHLPWVVNIAGSLSGPRDDVDATIDDRAAVEMYAESRRAWLLVTPGLDPTQALEEEDGP